MKRIVMLAALALTVLTATAPAEDNVIDRIVAIIDNEIILESELFQYIQFQIGSQAALERLSERQIDSLKSLVLEDLIVQKALLSKARLDTVVVEARSVDAELDARIKALIDQAGGQDRLEDYYGMPLAKIKRQFRTLVEESMLIDKVRQKKLAAVHVTPNDVNRFWEMYKDSIPELKDAVRLAHILLADAVSESSVDAALAKADSVRELIVSGQTTIVDYASRYSDDPGSASKGGQLGTTNRGDLVPEYEAVAYGLELGEISKPVISPFGVHIIKLNERVGEKISTSHILFRITPTAADKAQTAARADSILLALQGGADFAALALRYSSDAKTSGKGGDLGWFAPDELPPDFAGPVKGLKKGELSAPVRTRFGVHILKLTDRMFARPITLQEDYDRIQRMALAKRQDEVFQQWIAELSAQTYIERK